MRIDVKTGKDVASEWMMRLSAVLFVIIFILISSGVYMVGKAAHSVSTMWEDGEANLASTALPETSVITDVTGKPMAWIYDQNRTVVPSDGISPLMKKALISVEDRRFLQHKGVDPRGIGRALVTNLTAGGVSQGASTIEQQYVKNYRLLVQAGTPEERKEATEVSISRKLSEMRLALKLDEDYSKDEILTRYLNLVSFGNGTYGVHSASSVYFGKLPSDLSLPQAALLAGMVQSPEVLNPFTNPEGATQRRNEVLEAMRTSGAVPGKDVDAALKAPLEILPEPNRPDAGCIAAGDRGFFCDYVLEYLTSHGISMDRLKVGGLKVKTTLDPEVQDSLVAGLRRFNDPDAYGAATVSSLIRPGKDRHDVVAMGSSRRYGLDEGANQTVLPLPFSTVGDGAGSTFKVFTAAEALNQGIGLDTKLPVPEMAVMSGMGTGGAPGCPEGKWCVRNAGSYPSSMTLTDSLAQSPNTSFVELIGRVGVPATVDTAVRMGLRSYAAPGGVAEEVKSTNRGAFTLGYTSVNALELSNVAATIASGGMWCEPNPIASVSDRFGNDVPVNRPPCEEALPEGVARTLAHGMGQDVVKGTAANAARNVGWSGPVGGKTGTTETHRSSAFLGLTDQIAGATYTFSDLPTPQGLCSAPLRACGESGDLYGGLEPAEAWLAAVAPIKEKWGPSTLAAPDPGVVKGDAKFSVPEVEGKPVDEAERILRDAGYEVKITRTKDTDVEKDRVVKQTLRGPVLPGASVTLIVSDFTPPPPEEEPSDDDPEQGDEGNPSESDDSSSDSEEEG